MWRGGWSGGAAPQALTPRPAPPDPPPRPDTTPPRPSGVAHLDLLSLSCQNLVRKGGLDSRDWKETGSRQVKDPGMMGGGPEETHGGLGQRTEGKRGTAEAPSTPGGGAETRGRAQGTPQPAHLNVCGGMGPVGGEGGSQEGGSPPGVHISTTFPVQTPSPSTPLRRGGLDPQPPSQGSCTFMAFGPDFLWNLEP